MTIQQRNIKPARLRAGDAVRLRGEGFRYKRTVVTAQAESVGGRLVVGVAPFGPVMNVDELDWAGIKVDLLRERR